MKLVIQRVSRASVSVAGEMISAIDGGALILIGVAHDDTMADAEYLANKTSRLRIYNDASGQLNNSIRETCGAFLVVSQFTLYGSCRKGNRPSYIDAADPAEAVPLYEHYLRTLKNLGHEVCAGVFQEHMDVTLTNDGPVTVIIESRGR